MVPIDLSNHFVSGARPTVKAAYIDKTGSPDVIQYGDLPPPTPQTGEALVRVGAIAVNPIDLYIRAGNVAMPLPKPFIVGCDLAGTIEQLGPGASRFKVGDRVWGSNQGLLGRQGTFAEYAAVGEDWLYPTPPLSPPVPGGDKGAGSSRGTVVMCSSLPIRS